MCEDARSANRGSRRCEVLGRCEPFVTEGEDLGAERRGYEICEVIRDNMPDIEPAKT
jgi:hypothetical protein